MPKYCIERVILIAEDQSILWLIRKIILINFLDIGIQLIVFFKELFFPLIALR